MVTDFANFDALESRIRLTGRLTAVTGLRIGGGSDEEGATDMPILRDAQGYPMIGGSSLKGVLRSTGEAMLRTIGYGEWWACNPLSRSTATGPATADGACGQHSTGKRSDIKTENHCAACRLFGSHILSSHVRISDLLVSDRTTDPAIEVRDGVAIDRDLGVVFGGQKYDFEVISSGTSFDVEVFIDNPDDAHLGLLFACFEQLSEGFTALGGFTSRGLGRVRIDWQDLQTFNADAFFLGSKAEPISDPIELGRCLDTYRKALADAVNAQRGER